MSYDDAPFNYSKSDSSGPAAQLEQRLEKGEIHLQYEPQHGYLLSLLAALKVSKTSQMLVFSKSSFQRTHISPSNPRAIFFNDDTYVGFIPGAPLLEISVADPKLGAVFYTLNQTNRDQPRLVRNNDCLECHATSNTMGVPGHLVRSFVTGDDGSVDFSDGASWVDHRTPLAERWGGWYVTGTHGTQTHRGNLIGKAAFARHELKPGLSGNLTSLKTLLDTSRYPTPHSDIVALMVLEHQTHMHDFITRLNYEAAQKLAQYGEMKYLDNPIESFVKYLLFAEEAPLTAPIKGTSGFTAAFPLQGPRDKKGRSLRDFDLKTRLFKYPCSYLIYSPAFDALPSSLKANIYGRMWDILTGKNTSADYRNLSPESRRAILEILADTKSGLPDYWKVIGAGSGDQKNTGEFPGEWRARLQKTTYIRSSGFRAGKRPV